MGRLEYSFLDEAIEDIARGMRFYEFQEQGAGDYFKDSVFAESASLGIYAGLHSVRFGILPDAHEAFSIRYLL
jgi:hypothetical protein